MKRLMSSSPDEIVHAHLRGEEPQTEAEIAEATGLPIDQVQQALEYLAADGHLALVPLWSAV